MTEVSEVPFGLEVTKALFAKFLIAVTGFLGTIVFARILGPVAFGGFYLLWSIVQIAKLPVDGFTTASKKRFSETDANRGTIVGVMLTIVLCLSGIGVAVTAFFSTNISAFTGLAKSHVLFAVLFVSVSLFSPFQSMITAKGELSRTIWIDFLRSILTTPLQIFFVLLGYSTAGMAYGLSLATALTIPVSQYVLGTRPRLPSLQTFYRLWEFARHSVLSVTLGRVYSRIDIFFLGLLISPAAAGKYEVALKLTLPAVLASEVMGEGLMARVSNLESKTEQIGADVTNVLAFSSIVAVPLFFGALILARPLIVTVYGPEYTTASTLLIGLALFRLFRTQVDPLSQTLNGINCPDINVQISIVTLLVNIVLGVTLTIAVGATGVVIATVIAEGLTYVLTATVVSRSVGDVDLLPHTLIEQLAAAGVMVVVVFGAHQLIPVRSWTHLIVLVGLGVVTYTIAVLVLSEQLRHTTVSILADAGVSRWFSG